jgi:hypothetical protein
MESVPREAHLAEAYEGASCDAVWEFRGIMAKDILPDRPADRRRRSRLCALRAMDRLGLLGEENLIPTLARRPELRWLADEQGARWAVLAELGRVGEPKAFEEAVEWALEARPHPEEVRAHVLLLRRAMIGDILLLEVTKWKRLPGGSIRLFRRQGALGRGTNQG